MPDTLTPSPGGRSRIHLTPQARAIGPGLLVASATIGFALTLIALIILVALCIYGLRHVRHLTRGD